MSFFRGEATIAIGVRSSREFHTKNIARLELKMVTIPFRIDMCALRLLTVKLLAVETSTVQLLVTAKVLNSV